MTTTTSAVPASKRLRCVQSLPATSSVPKGQGKEESAPLGSFVSFDRKWWTRSWKSSLGPKDFVKSPTIARDEKVAAVALLVEGSKARRFTAKTLTALAANARLSEVDKVIDAYSTLMKAERKEVDAVITSATELTAAQTKKISAALKPHLKQGETVKLSAKVDPSLLGGLTVQIGDKYLDLSAATKIGAISRAL